VPGTQVEINDHFNGQNAPQQLINYGFGWFWGIRMDLGIASDVLQLFRKSTDAPSYCA
jgi:hypothetical protein